MNEKIATVYGVHRGYDFRLDPYDFESIPNGRRIRNGLGNLPLGLELVPRPPREALTIQSYNAFGL